MGGVAGSAHTRGLAADIACRDSALRYQLLVKAWGLGFKRIGVYGTSVHLDIDRQKPQRVVWLG